jgi:hypothetical protein
MVAEPKGTFLTSAANSIPTNSAVGGSLGVFGYCKVNGNSKQLLQLLGPKSKHLFQPPSLTETSEEVLSESGRVHLPPSGTWNMAENKAETQPWPIRICEEEQILDLDRTEF